VGSDNSLPEPLKKKKTNEEVQNHFLKQNERFRTPSSKPKFEPKRVDPVEIISEQSLVSDEAQVLVEPQRGLVRDLRLKDDLKGNNQG